MRMLASTAWSAVWMDWNASPLARLFNALAHARLGPPRAEISAPRRPTVPTWDGRTCLESCTGRRSRRVPPVLQRRPFAPQTTPAQSVPCVSAPTPTIGSHAAQQAYGTETEPSCPGTPTAYTATTAFSSAPSSRCWQDVPSQDTTTSAPAVVISGTGHLAAVERSRSSMCTPLKADVWERALRDAGLVGRYPTLVQSIRSGFHVGIPRILSTFVPFNSPSLMQFSGAFESIVQHELSCGRYIGPFSRSDLEALIGPFQSSPLSLTPKPHKPNVYRLVQNFSFPHDSTPTRRSMNSFINSDDYPCTWGTFTAFALMASRLPPGSQGAVRDISEAYRLIPLHPSQWLGTVIRYSNNDEFIIDLAVAFGLSGNAGIFGHLADALVDILRFHGIGPVAKWVDDHVFIRLPRSALPGFNALREQWREAISDNGGMHHTEGRLWFKGGDLPDGQAEEFVEDMKFPMRDLSTSSPRDPQEVFYTYSIGDINRISDALGIP